MTALWLSPLPANPGGAYPGSDKHRAHRLPRLLALGGPGASRSLGSLEALQALTAAAHDRGIRVLADMVFNHVHASHPYAADSASVNGDGSCVCGAPGYGWEDFPAVCWFTDYLPDLNWQQDAAADAMVESAIYWLNAPTSMASGSTR